MKYWDTCEDIPELDKNVIMAKEGANKLGGKCGLRKVGYKVEIIKPTTGESECAFEIEDMIYGLRCAIRNFVENNDPNIGPRATCEEDVSAHKELIEWLELEKVEREER